MKIWFSCNTGQTFYGYKINIRKPKLLKNQLTDLSGLTNYQFYTAQNNVSSFLDVSDNEQF